MRAREGIADYAGNTMAQKTTTATDSKMHGKRDQMWMLKEA